MNFDDLPLHPVTKDILKKRGFTKPTEIQERSLPLILEGKDVVGESATGTGKTLAFACGILQTLDSSKGLQALVLAPTRELAEQVTQSIRQLLTKTRVTAIYGGVAINPQIDAIAKSHIVVATPGRLLDHLERNTIDLSGITTLVLDEADRMLDMGFIEDVEKIMAVCPKNRQTLFFSATISPRIQSLVRRHMKDPVKISAKVHVDPSKLKQVYYDTTRNGKISLLAHLLKNEKSGLAMIFCNTRRTTDFVARNLEANKIDAIAIHGGLTQQKRTRTISTFNSGKVGVLICTDVAARGLHIDNVSHVYNYDIPKSPTEYVHRIGRTARAGADGLVINLIAEMDYDNFSRIVNDRTFTIEKVETPKTDRIKVLTSQHPRRNGPRRGGRDNGPRRGNFRKKRRPHRR